MEFSSPKSNLVFQQGEEKSISNSSCRIPEDLYHEILLRLPVKSILICKSVCKSWLSISSNPTFVKLHLQRNKNNPSSNSLLLAYCNDMNPISYDSLESSLSAKEIEDRAVSLRMCYPPLNSGIELGSHSVRLCGSCNGLLFLWVYDGWWCTDDDDSESDNSDDCNSGRGGKDDVWYVWNPATGEYKDITPQSPNSYFLRYLCITGLGYDCKNDNYKFVVGSYIDESDLNTFVEIFSLRSNSWETFETPYSFASHEQQNGVFVNGDLYWLAKGERGVCIVYFDSSSDIPSFIEIQLPMKPNLEFVSLGVLEEGCLSVVADNCNPASALGRVEVWEMQINGVRESWTKRYVISNETLTTAVMDKSTDLEIMWCFKNGKIVFVDRNVVVYDPKHGTVFERKLDKLEYYTSKVTYFQSLVSLNTSTYVGTKLSK